MTISTSLLIYLLFTACLVYQRASLKVWSFMTVAYVMIAGYSMNAALLSKLSIGIATILILMLFNVPQLRHTLFTRLLLTFFKKRMPALSKTEEEALRAGTVGFEGELFNGNPDWQKFLQHSAPRLTEEEKAFLNGPVEQLCDLINDWNISIKQGDLTPELWNFIKKEGFFGLIIPKQYGGKGFSALAHAQVLVKLGLSLIHI